MSGLRKPRRMGGVVLEDVGDELFVFNPLDEKMHALNQAAAQVLKACDGDRTVEEIGAFVADQGLSADMVQLGLVDLRAAGLIEYTADAEAPSRRELLIKLGAGAAAVLAIPVVESILAPTAAAASSSPSPTPTPTPSPWPTPTPTPTPCWRRWDKSSYKAGAIDCTTGIAEVCNVGETATCPVKYKVLFSRGGNPKKGRIILQGTIPALGATGNCGTVDFSSVLKKANGDPRSGRYMVMFYQHPQHRGRGVVFTESCRL